MYIGATVLLPKGFDEEPARRYPAIYIQGHFGLGAPFGFTDRRGSRDSRSSDDARLRRSAREPGWMFARDWMSDNFPRMVAITWQHPTPYYDDSYAVNSVNNGPYQDALLTELVPLLEKQFRLIPEPNARFLTGGSTGGWECAALQSAASGFLWRRVVPVPRSRRLSSQPDGRQLRRHQRVRAERSERRRSPNDSCRARPRASRFSPSV